MTIEVLIRAEPHLPLGDGMSMAPTVYDLGSATGLSRLAEPRIADPVADAGVADEESAPVPVSATVTRRRVSDAATRVGRRSRLRAAHVEAMSRAEAEGRALDVGRDTNEFVAAMRADIARASLHSQRPPLVRYVIRRWVTNRSESPGTMLRASG